MLSTLIFYLIVMFVCLGLTYWSHQNHTNHGVYFAYIIILLVSIFRYDIGNDYENYIQMIKYMGYNFNNNINFADEVKEPLFTILIYLFKDLSYSYLWVIGIHFLISLIFLYKAFKENDSHLIGILIFFINGMFFIYWDQIRQAVSISIFLYALKYIKEQNFSKYLLFVLLATTAHFSAILLLPFYYINKIKPHKIIYITIILLLTLSNAATDFFTYLFDYLIVLIPYYDTKDTSFSYVQILSFGYKFRVFFYGVLWSTVIYFLPKKERLLINLLFIGAIIFIIASGALNIMRISFYFIFTITISIHIVLKIEKARLLMRIMILGLFFFFVRDVITDTGTRGCVPYDSIFSDNFPNYTRPRK